jgi:hypothetical protein
MIIGALYVVKKAKIRFFGNNSISSANTEKSSLKTDINIAIPQILSAFLRLWLK